MKFDVIIGNPPYQSGNQSIYQLFIENAMNFKTPHICMIVKRNWFKGNTLKKTRDHMVYYGLKTIIDYPIVYEVFPDIHSTVAIFSLFKGYEGKCRYFTVKNGMTTSMIDIQLKTGDVILSNNERTILDKVTKHQDYMPWSLSKNPRIFSIGSNGLFMHSTYTEDLITYKKTKETEDDIAVYFMDGSKNWYKKYTNRKELPKGEEWIDTWKVVCGSKAQDNSSVVTNLGVLAPEEIMTNSFGIIAILPEYERDKAQIIAKYSSTKFFKVLVKFAIAGDKVTLGDEALHYVPQLNFDERDNIDWSLSSKKLDKQLYEKFGLNNAEIEYIESLIN